MTRRPPIPDHYGRILDHNGDPVTYKEAQPGPRHVPDGCEWCRAVDAAGTAPRRP